MTLSLVEHERARITTFNLPVDVSIPRWTSPGTSSRLRSVLLRSAFGPGLAKSAVGSVPEFASSKSPLALDGNHFTSRVDICGPPTHGYSRGSMLEFKVR